MLLKISFLSIGLTTLSTLSPVFGSDETKNKSADSNQNYLGTHLNPIVLDIKKIKNYDMIDFLLKDYIQKHYEGYDIAGKLYTMRGDHFITILSLRDEEKNRKMVYFDMTGAYKKLGKSNDKNTRKKIKEQEDRHRPMSDEEFQKRQKEEKENSKS